MKVFVQIVDARTGIYQTGMIDEPVINRMEITNALKHFGPSELEVDWNSNFVHVELENSPRLMTGVIRGTNKIVNVVAYEQNSIYKGELERNKEKT